MPVDVHNHVADKICQLGELDFNPRHTFSKGVLEMLLFERSIFLRVVGLHLEFLF